MDDLFDYPRRDLARNLWWFTASEKIPEAVKALASKHVSQVCTHLLDRMRLATASLMPILRTQTICTAGILAATLGSFSFLYAFSNPSRFVVSMTWLYGK